MDLVKFAKRTFIRQQGQSDCGVACLTSIVRYHGGDVTLERVRELSGATQRGTTLLGLYHAAQLLGCDAEGLEADGVDNLKEVQGPAILHVVINGRVQHYFVYYGSDKLGRIIVGDPAKGIFTYKPDQLAALWQSKTLLQLIPNPSFVKVKAQNNKKKQWVVDLLKEDVNVLIAALFLGVIIASLGLTTAVFSQKLIDNILPSEDTQTLGLSLVMVGLLLLARSGLGYVRGLLFVKQGTDFNNRIIQKFYGGLLYLPKPFFDFRKTGDLIARMNDTRRIQTTISLISGNILIDLLLILVAIVFVFVYSSWLGLVSLACLPVYGLLVWLFNNKIVTSQREVMSGYALAESHYVDTIQGIATVKSFNRESFFEKMSKHVYGLFQNKTYELGRVNLRFGLLNEITGIAFAVVLFGLSSWMVLRKDLQLGEMVAILSITGNIIPSLNRLAVANIHFQEARVAFDRLFEFASLKSDYNSNESSVSILDIQNLTVDKLSFRFPGRTQLLKEVSLRVTKGEIISILGESGGGKSTLLQIIQKFYKSESGTIEVNGINLDRISTQIWRNLIGIVPQDVKIFNGNLLYNIALSDSPEEYQAVIQYCKQVGFDKYFEMFPQGYLTILGEEGVNLSGGQKQVVAVARALFRRPKLLLLDEVTAAMDKNTENFILQLLLNLKHEIIIILVTHRIQTARRANKIYILQGGEIVNSGTPEILMESENFYSSSVKEFASFI